MSHKRTATAVLCLVIVCIAGCGGQLQSGTSTALPPTRQSTVTLGVSATPAASIAAESTATPAPTTALIAQATTTPLPSPTQSSNLSPTQLKYLLIDKFGAVGSAPGIFYCDPDQFPVAHDVGEDQVRQWFDSVDKSGEEFHVVLQHANLQTAGDLTSTQQLLVYQEFKRLNAITLEKAGDAYAYQFRLRVAQRVAGQKASGLAITGTITSQGAITVLSQQPTILTCPICLALGTRIDTPIGPIAVQDIQPGMLVWTVGRSGERTAAPVIQTAHTPVPSSHQVIALRLDDGRELRASAGHPTADGRTLGTLALGDVLDGARVVGVDRVLYRAAETYDILPAGETGFYWADGILMGSTLASTPVPPR